MQYLPYASKIIAIVQIRHFKLDHVWELFTDQLMTLSYSQPYQRHCFSILSRPTPSRFGTWQAMQDPKLISGIRAVTHLYSDTVTDMHMVMDSFSSHIASLAIFLRDLSFKSCMSAFLLLTRLPIWMYPYLFVNINLLSVINSKFWRLGSTSICIKKDVYGVLIQCYLAGSYPLEGRWQLERFKD